MAENKIELNKTPRLRRAQPKPIATLVLLDDMWIMGLPDDTATESQRNVMAGQLKAMRESGWTSLVFPWPVSVSDLRSKP